MNEIQATLALLSAENLQKALEKLENTSIPVFGEMTPQQMLEHLCLSIDLSYTKPFTEGKEISEMQKQTRLMFLNTENPFPKNLKSPLYKEGMPALKYENLDSAKDAFLASVQNFHTHFVNNPTTIYYNMLFGKVSFEDLQIFHFKHILHHFSQFNLV
ncbi:MAG: DUF1569 domain-containing protein [Bacteroidetes bacterium]|nr:MAG: DUF1569 domain-containing protein [Bacteroidota bacterium]TAG85675.1 MAG: DUF1569 domain-containing protein [Bacteroidota bacterium]